jgi:RiboL-PSP-HEPN
LLGLKAVFNAAKEDFEGGYLSTTRSLAQAEVFDDELEQARELQSKGYKDAAAVVAGVVLETTLRELCTRAGISHGKLDKMNSDLAKAGVYNVLNQKRITTLADIRNSAAHGKLDNFTPDDVDNMIRDVEKFVADHVTTI